MSARILVVDDNALNVKLLVEWLEHEAYVVDTAADGFEALSKTGSRQIAVHNFHLGLLTNA